jgi:hypothetical protein
MAVDDAAAEIDVAEQIKAAPRMVVHRADGKAATAAGRRHHREIEQPADDADEGERRGMVAAAAAGNDGEHFKKGQVDNDGGEANANIIYN